MSECNHKFEGWNEDDIEVCVICEKPTAEIAHALQQQLDACKAENGELKDAILSERHRYRRLIENGKGSHGHSSYVTDASWNNWIGSMHILDKLARILRSEESGSE